jgi:hypothetical protein
MTETISVLTMPALSNLPNVEIAQTGQWDASTGRVTLTRDDFSMAIAALDCPAIRNPVLKLGHDEPMPSDKKKRWDGEPALGYVGNMGVADDGNTIVGDYLGMPGWLGPVIPSAYPDRSMEASFDFICQLGHLHPFVITAVALLGVVPPAIGTLDSLQSVASLYGVTASSKDPGTGFSVVIHAKEATMPNPNPREVAAGVTTEDVRRQFYDTAGYTVWIKEFELDPPQLITVDEATGEYARIPITISDGAAVFGEPIGVEIEYVDTPAVAASAGRLVYASRDESRASIPPVQQTAKDIPPVAAINRVHAASTATRKDGTGMDPVKLREALGLAADASDADVTAAALTALNITPAPTTEPATDPTPATVPAAVAASTPGVMVLDTSVVAELQRQAARGEEAFKMMQTSRRDQTIARALELGKFAPARKAEWERLYDADPDGTEATIASLSPNLVPLQASGFPGTDTYQEDQTYYALFPESKKAG